MSKSRPKKRKKKNLVLRLIIIIAIIVGAILVMHLDYFNVSGIAVIGNDEIADEEVIHLSDIKIGESVFDVHPLISQYKIKKNLYIEEVNVNRKLPNQVEVIIKERSCTAQFAKGKYFVVTDNEGMVIETSTEAKETTLIENITVLESKKKKTIKVKEEEVLNRALEFVTLANKKDLYFKKISIDGNKITAYVFDELVCVGKYSDMVDTIKSGTLKSVIYDLYQKSIEKGTVKVYDNDYCFFTQ